MRGPDLFFVGRNVDCFWALAHRYYGLSPGGWSRSPLNNADAVRSDVRGEDPMIIFADNYHVGRVLAGSHQPVDLIGCGIVTSNQLVDFCREVDLSISEEHPMWPAQRP